MLWGSGIEDNIEHLKEYLNEKQPPFFATVGDYVTTHVLDAGLHPEIAVVDHKIMRREVTPVEFKCDHLTANNPAGTITAEAQEALYNALESENGFRLVIDGEEDLLVLPLMTILPINSVIIYGQPKEGMVVILLDEERIEWAKAFMNSMESA